MNQTKHAVILAAGAGKRLLPFTNSNPKCFAQVAGKRILENALEALAANGCEQARIVTGHHADLIRREITDQFCGMKITYIYNQIFQTTNSMYSLALGLDGLKSATWVIEGDVFFEHSILSLPASSEIAWYVDSTARHLDGCFIESDANDRAISQKIVRDLSLLQPNQSKSIGILKLSSEGLRKLQNWLDLGIKAGRQNDYYDLIVGSHMMESNVQSVNVAGHKWFETDTNEDLEKANQLFQ